MTDRRDRLAEKRKETVGIKRAVRDAYDAGWSDGGARNKSNDGWNRLARKYGMREVK